MKEKTFLSSAEQKTISFGKFKTKSPLFFYDLNLMGGVFPIHLKAVQKILPKDKQPVSIFPGLALASVFCLEYKESDIGLYNEVAIAIPVLQPKYHLPGRLRFLPDLLLRNFSTYVCYLAVTSEVAQVGGDHVFGRSKCIADVSFRETATHRICTLRDKKTLDLILEVDLKKAKTQHVHQNSPELYTIQLFPEKENLKKLSFQCNLLEREYFSVMPQMSLRWGGHDVAQSFKELKWGYALCGVFAPQAEAKLIPYQSKKTSLKNKRYQKEFV